MGSWLVFAVFFLGAVVVAEFIVESFRFLRLDFRENEIKTGGFMVLSLVFKVNYFLLRLDFDREFKKEAVSWFFLWLYVGLGE